jgi:hypothetical protein
LNLFVQQLGGHCTPDLIVLNEKKHIYNTTFCRLKILLGPKDEPIHRCFHLPDPRAGGRW